MISLNDISIIIQIYEKKNFSVVAEDNFLGQSALSHKIKKVEDELGYIIFNRGRGDREISLTERGKVLIPLLYDMKSIYKEICEIKNLEERKNLRIASTDGPFFLAIDPVVEKLLAKNENYSFNLHTANFNECLEALKRDYVDIAFVGKVSTIKNIRFVPLYREDICLVARRDYFSKTKVKLSELDPAKAVISNYSDDLMNWFSDLFDQRNPLILCDLNSELERFILSKDLWSFVPISLAKEFEKNGIKVYRFSENIPKRVIYYAIKNDLKDSGVELVLSEIRKELKRYRHIEVYS